MFHFGQLCASYGLERGRNHSLPRRINMTQPTITLAGTVQKPLDRSTLKQPQLVQLSFQGADHRYGELRIPNTLGWEEGRAVEVTFGMLPADLPRAI